MDTEKYLSLPSSWSKEQTCLLIEEFRQHPVLYDQKSNSYSSKTLRHIAIRKIIAKLKPYKPNITHADILNKIKSLRSQYSREKNKIADSLTQRKVYKPKLWCYDMIKYLDQSNTINKSKHHSVLKADDEDIEELIEESYDDDSSNPFEEIEIEPLNQIETPSNHARDVLHTKCLKLVECLTSEMQNVRDDKGTGGSSQQAPSTFLGLMVESELAKVTEEIYDDAKWKIIRILEEASKRNREVQKLPV